MVDWGLRDLAEKLIDTSRNISAGFIKDRFLAVSKKWEKEGVLNDQGTGHPDKISSEMNREFAYDFFGNKVNYNSPEGKELERKMAAVYVGRMYLPDFEWQEMIDKYSGIINEIKKTPAETKDAYKALSEKLLEIENVQKKLCEEFEQRALKYVKPENVVMTFSGTNSFAVGMISCTKEGDTVIAPEGYYNAYNATMHVLGLNKTLLEAQAEDNFTIKKGSLINAYKSDPKASYICFPAANPTANNMTKENALLWINECIEVEKFIDENNKGAQNPKRKVHYQSDVVYDEIRNREEEDAVISKVLNEVIEQGGEKADWAKKVKSKLVTIISDSKVNNNAGTGGAIVSEDLDVIETAKGMNIFLNVGAPTFSSALFSNFLQKVNMDKINLIMEGKDPRSNGFVFDMAEGYNIERTYFNSGIMKIAEAFGVGGEKLFPHNSGKALYSFSMIARLLGNFDFNAQGGLKDGVDPKDYVLDDDNKTGKIKNGSEAARLLYSMVGREDNPIGLKGRPGPWFGVDEALRLNITGEREKHIKSLKVMYDALQFIGATPHKEFDSLVKELNSEEKTRLQEYRQRQQAQPAIVGKDVKLTLSDSKLRAASAA